MPFGAWEAASMALEVGKHPVAPLVPQFRQRVGEIGLIIHTLLPFPAPLAPFLRRVPRALSRRYWHSGHLALCAGSRLRERRGRRGRTGNHTTVSSSGH